jgi:hypothetical protein
MSSLACTIGGGPARVSPTLGSHLGLSLAVAIAVALSASADATTLIAKNSSWKYSAGPTDLGDEWRDPSYDDSAWPSGPGPLGYGEPYIQTMISFGPDSSMKYRTTYFRQMFHLGEKTANIMSLTLAANYDDGFVAYLNGAEVTRQAMPAGPVTYDTLAMPHEGGAYEVIDLTAAIPKLVPGMNVLAVEVHQGTLSSSDLVFDIDLQYSTQPVVTRGPYLQIGTPTSVRVRWRTNLPVGSRVRYGTAPGGLSLFADDPPATSEHEIAVTGLTADTRYYYSVGTLSSTLAGDDSTYFFVTAPLPGTPKPTRIWAVGDCGFTGQDSHDVRDAYSAYTGYRPTDLWLLLGDNAYVGGTDEQYQQSVFGTYPGMLRKSVLWPTRGNHDSLYVGPNNDYYDIFSMPTAAEAGGVPSGTEAYYSFDYGNIHFIGLDSEGSDRSPEGAMMTWLGQDVAASSKDWIIAFWHHPPYSHGTHNSDNDQDSGGRMGDMRRNALPILEATGVDLVLTGHSHSYERSFLLDGHYGPSDSLTAEMKVDPGDGRIGGNGAYLKPTVGSGQHEGAVYVVAGSSSTTSADTLVDHPVMVASLGELGSLVIDVAGTRLDAHFVSHTGAVLDSFTIIKGQVTGATDRDSRPCSLELSLHGSNPSASGIRMSYRLPRAGRMKLSIFDPAGRHLAILADGFEPAGNHQSVWVGKDDQGRRVASGVYFGVLEFQGERRAVKIVRSW